MIVGISKAMLFLPASRSLKDKRQVLRSIKDKTFAKFGIRISEVEDLDLWQKATLGFAIVGNDKTVVEALINKIIESITFSERYHLLDRYQEIINL